MRNLDELDIVFQKLETLEDQKREAEIAKLRSKITKSYVINTVLAALMYIALLCAIQVAAQHPEKIRIFNMPSDAEVVL